MPSLGQLVESTKRLVIPFGSTELKVQYRPSAVTPRFQKAVERARTEGDIDALILEPLCRLLASWDLTTEDGSLIPIDAEHLADLPVPVLVELMQRIGEDMAPGPLRVVASSSTSSATDDSALSLNGTSS